MGVVCSMKDSFGFIERADVVKEIFFHYSEYQAGNVGDLQLGDDVEFNVAERNVRRKWGGDVFASLRVCVCVCVWLYNVHVCVPVHSCVQLYLCVCLFSSDYVCCLFMP